MYESKQGPNQGFLAGVVCPLGIDRVYLFNESKRFNYVGPTALLTVGSSHYFNRYMASR